ncbi:MAG: hypothetical protein ACRCTI_06805, partial [Beijerinckiaceae bacterium]
ASAMLAAAAVSGPGLGLLLAALAPLPLMIVGFGWHPLMAVLGGAITAAALSAMLRGSAGVVFAVLVMVPAYLAAWIAWRGDLDERVRMGLLAVGATLYAAIATLIGAFSISFDYAELQAHLLRQSELVFRIMSGLGRDAPLEPIRGQDPRLFIQTYAQLVAPLSALILGVIYLANIWIAVRVAEASGRLPTPRAPVSQMLYPRLLLPFAALALLGGLMPGYLGLAMELAGVAAVLALIALGFAAIHEVTRGVAARPLILAVLWALTLAMGVPVLGMLFVGIAELAFGWRARRADRNS